MRIYETGFLLAPNLSEEETEKLITQMADVISQKEGKLIKQERWGKRRMAYSIKRFSEAFYVFFHYEGRAGHPPRAGEAVQADRCRPALPDLEEGSQEATLRQKKKNEPEPTREAAPGGGRRKGRRRGRGRPARESGEEVK